MGFISSDALLRSSLRASLIESSPQRIQLIKQPWVLLTFYLSTSYVILYDVAEVRNVDGSAIGCQSRRRGVFDAKITCPIHGQLPVRSYLNLAIRSRESSL